MKDLRNQINKAANQHTEFVDSDTIWAGIEQKMTIPKKERRIIPFLIWGFSLTFVVFSISGLYFLSKNQKSVATNIDPKTNSKKTSKVDNEVESTYIYPQTENSINSEEYSEAPSNTKITADVKLINTKNKDDNTAFEKTKNLIFSAQNSSPEGIQNYTSKFDFSGILKNKTNTFIQEKNTNKSGVKKDLLNQNKSLSIERRRIEFSKITSSLNVVYSRPKIDIYLLEYVPSNPMSSKERKNFSFLSSFTTYTQYGFGSKNIQGNSNYATLRNQSEEMLEQVRIGIESDLMNFLDFTLYGGLSYVSINDRLSSEYSYYEDREITYVERIIVDPDGTETEVLATDDLPHLITNQAKRYNSHRLISMPFGFRFGKGFSKINLGIAFGLDLNYSLSDMHTRLSADGELTQVPVGGKWLSPSIHTGISADYPITDRWFLHSKISYRNTKIENISRESNVQESYSIYGIDLGVKIKF